MQYLTESSLVQFFFHMHIFQDVQNIDQTFLDVLQDVESDDEGF